MEKWHSLLQKYFPSYHSDDGSSENAIDQSVEFQNLRKVISESNTSICESIRKELALTAIKKGLAFNECDRTSIVYKRSLGLRFPISKNHKEGGEIEYIELVLAISLLAPVYFLEVVTSKIQEGVVLEEKVSLESVSPETFNFISEIMMKKGYSRMLSSEYGKVISDRISLEIEPGSFTYFNAFFGNSIGDLLY